MPVEDLRMTRRVQREVGKRTAINSTEIYVRAIHGVVYITGRVRLTRGETMVDLKEEVSIIVQNIKRIPGIRDVIVDVDFPL